MGFELPKEWKATGIDPDELSEHTISFDKWDDAERVARLTDVSSFAAAREILGEAVATGEPAMDDTFWSLLKANPELLEKDRILPSHLVNATVIGEMHKLPEYKRLRRYSAGDDVQAALSSAEMEPELETLFDKLEQERQQAQELLDSLLALAGACVASDAAETDLEGIQARLEAAAEQGAAEPRELTDEERAALEAAQEEAAATAAEKKRLQDAVAEQADALSDALDDAQSVVSIALRDAFESAADTAQANEELASCWGADPGDLKRMNAEERIALAKILKNERFRLIAEKFGPMRNLMLSEQKRKTSNIPEEIYDVEHGDELFKMLPSEMVGMRRHRGLRLLFLRKYVTRSVLQYAKRGTEKLARGGIIFCEDGSGSMSGDREMWSKAVMLCLLDLARRQKRTMHVIHFGGPGTFKTFSFTKPSDFTFERVIEVAEVFYGGGTNFETPMAEALRILQEEHAATGCVRADVVFMTDDECYVREPFMKSYLDEMERMDATTWGISATGQPVDPNGPLGTMCQGKTATVRDFQTGRDVAMVFRGV